MRIIKLGAAAVLTRQPSQFLTFVSESAIFPIILISPLPQRTVLYWQDRCTSPKTRVEGHYPVVEGRGSVALWYQQVCYGSIIDSYCQGCLASYSSNRLYPTPYPEVTNGDQ